MDYLCECNNDRDRREALKKLPPDLPSSYERILERVNRSSKENQDLVKKTLHWIEYAEGDFPVEQLLQALAVRDRERHFDSSSITTVEDILHWCSSLVRRTPGEDTLELAHFTVKEFLQAIDPVQKPPFQQYRLCGDHKLLAKACLNFIRCQEFDGLPCPDLTNDDVDESLNRCFDFRSNYPFIEYACREWSFHVHQSYWDDIKDDVWDIFRTESTLSFWTFTWLTFQFREYVYTSNYFEKSLAVTGLHWAAVFALDRLCAMFIERGANVSQPSYMGSPLYCVMVADQALVPHFDWMISEIRNHGHTVWRRPAREAVFCKLIKAGADLDMMVDPEGQRRALTVALEVEIYSRSPFMVSILLDAGATLSVSDFVILRKGLDYLVGPPPPPPPHRGNLEAPVMVSHTLCGIAPSYLINAVKRDGWKGLVRGAEFGFFSFALNIASWNWPLETFQSFLHVTFTDLFPESNGSELDLIIADESKDWLDKLINVLSKAIRYSAVDTSQAILSLERSLRYAVRADNGPVVSLLITYNDDLNASYQDAEWEETLLHLVACKRSREKANFYPLILRGANVVFCPDKYGFAPIELEARICDTETFTLFWDLAMRATASEISLEMATKTLRCAMGYNDEPGYNNKPVVLFLIEQLIESKIMRNDSLLEFALSSHTSMLLEVILDPEHDFNYWWTASSISEEGDSEEGNNEDEEDEAKVEEDKEETGKDEDDRKNLCSENSYMMRSDSGTEETESTPLELEALYLAASPNASPANFIYLLKRGVEAFHPYQNGNTIAHILARNEDKNSFDKLQYLLQSRPHLSNILNDAGLTPLAIAVQSGNLAVIELLLDEGTNPDTLLANNQTVLHMACEQGNWTAVNYLLDNCCDTSRRNSQGLTAADVAWSMGYLDFVALIRNESFLGHATTSQQKRSMVCARL
jgi:hypothetical protein